MSRLTRLILSALTALAFASCFTGIESTPKITSGDVRRRQTFAVAENDFLSDVSSTRPSLWTEGKRFYVTDDKISVIFTVASDDKDSLAGHELIFKSFAPTSSLTGEGATDIVMTSDRGDDLHYIVNVPYDELMKRERFDIPFTVERSVVESFGKAMTGKRYYITTPKWYDSATDKEIKALRHIPVTVAGVTPGNSVYPLKVTFTNDSVAGDHYVLMTYGRDKASTRNFGKIFAAKISSPMPRIPSISMATAASTSPSTPISRPTVCSGSKTAASMPRPTSAAALSMARHGISPALFSRKRTSSTTSSPQASIWSTRAGRRPTF